MPRYLPLPPPPAALKREILNPFYCPGANAPNTVLTGVLLPPSCPQFGIEMVLQIFSSLLVGILLFFLADVSETWSDTDSSLDPSDCPSTLIPPPQVMTTSL